MDDDKKLILAIGNVREDMAALKEKYDHLSNYIFRDLKPDIEKLCDKIEDCVEKSEKCYQKNMECYHKNLRWMIATLLAFIAAVLGWTGVLLMRMI